mmetsp:Transcript_97265/g.172154  ORF Transcript_97265/g.172154 Transcript_97265/m.172154 type:complete len:823 (-) Transcript_97265:151-2619(-)
MQVYVPTSQSDRSTSASAGSQSVSLSQCAAQVVEHSGGGGGSLESHVTGITITSQISRGSFCDDLLVTACGRTCSLSRDAGNSVMELQGALQSHLCMEGQTFHVFDIAGTPIQTDCDLIEAIESGQTPLVATLTDATIHDIENRREELAQMQWKLIRDQMAAMLGKLGTLTRQIGDLQLQQDTSTRERDLCSERSRAELCRAIAQEREVTKAELRQCAERVNAVVQLFNGEKNKRELGLQHADKRFQDFHSLHDEEVHARRREQATYDSRLQEVRAQMDNERQERAALENRQNTGMQDLRERLELVFSQHAQMMQDQVATFKDFPIASQSLDELSRQLLKMRTEAEFSASESNSRINELEHRCTVLETRLSEGMDIQVSSVERLRQRHEKMSQALEQFKLDKRQDQSQVQDIFDKVCKVESTLMNREGETREIMLKERLMRDEQLRRARQGLSEEHFRQLADIERKLVERLDHESAMRESSVGEIVGEVSKMFDMQKMMERVSAPWMEEADIEDMLGVAGAEIAQTAKSTAGQDQGQSRTGSSIAIYEPKGQILQGQGGSVTAPSGPPAVTMQIRTARSPGRQPSPTRPGSFPVGTVVSTASLAEAAGSPGRGSFTAPVQLGGSFTIGQPATSTPSAEISQCFLVTSPKGSMQLPPGTVLPEGGVVSTSTVPQNTVAPASNGASAAPPPTVVRVHSPSPVSSGFLLQQTRQSSGRAMTPHGSSAVLSRQSSASLRQSSNGATAPQVVVRRDGRSETPRSSRAAVTQAASLSNQRTPSTSSISGGQRGSFRQSGSFTLNAIGPGHAGNPRRSRPTSQNSRPVH